VVSPCPVGGCLFSQKFNDLKVFAAGFAVLGQLYYANSIPRSTFRPVKATGADAPPARARTA